MGLPIDNTELLTTEGFKDVKDITTDDFVLTYNYKYKIFEFQKVLHITEEEKRMIYCLKNEFEATLDTLLPTADREMTVRDCLQREKPKKFVKQSKLYVKGLDIDDDFLRLLVWVQKGTRTHITPKKIRMILNKQEQRERVMRLLGRLGFEYRVKKTAKYGYCIYIHNDFIVQMVKEYLDDCKLTSKWLGMSMRQFEIFKEEFLLASMSSKRNRYTNKDMKQLDLICAIFIVHGEIMDYHQYKFNSWYDGQGDVYRYCLERKAPSQYHTFDKEKVTTREGVTKSIITLNKHLLVKQRVDRYQNKAKGYAISIVGGHEKDEEKI